VTIVGLLLKHESLWIIGGTTFGFVGAVMVGFLLRAEFFHASAASVPDLTASSILLLVPALAAISVPARRVSMLDPRVTLRRGVTFLRLKPQPAE
jgi:hypothetical protein